MHEWGLIRGLVTELECAAAQHGARKIRAVRIRISRELWRSPNQLRDQFDMVASGTPAEGAMLAIEYFDESQPQTHRILLEDLEIET